MAAKSRQWPANNGRSLSAAIASLTVSTREVTRSLHGRHGQSHSYGDIIISANAKPKEKLVQHYKTRAHHFKKNHKTKRKTGTHKNLQYYKTRAHHFRKHKSIFRTARTFQTAGTAFPKMLYVSCRNAFILFEMVCVYFHRRHAQHFESTHAVTPAPMA